MHEIRIRIFQEMTILKCGVGNHFNILYFFSFVEIINYHYMMDRPILVFVFIIIIFF